MRMAKDIAGLQKAKAHLYIETSRCGRRRTKLVRTEWLTLEDVEMRAFCRLAEIRALLTRLSGTRCGQVGADKMGADKIAFESRKCM
jgi:hypothetical protein